MFEVDMKKFLSVICLYLVAALPVSAVITPDDATSQGYIENHGHSSEMARLIDLQNAQINGEKSVYVSKEPSWHTSNKFFRAVRNVFIYFDPALDDGKFQQHDTRFGEGFSDL